MSESDPTDHALATIASILDQPETPPGPERATVSEPEPDAPAMAPATPDMAPATSAMAATDGDGYSRVGPGPIAAIRFKWTARREANGAYFVDETIGETSTPVVSGPMTREAAVAMIDQRESEARHRFEQLRQEITGRATDTELTPRGEA